MAVAVSASGAARAAVAETAAEVPAADAASSDDILVTARKVSEKLQDVPVAITALSGEELRRNNHIRLEDLNQLSPSTVVVVTNGHQMSVSIRGIGNNPGSDGLENSAGIFVDGVYLGRPGMAAMDLIDIQQIEQLRGPQGTLFGKNTTAGALNITTALPSFDFGVRAAATYGNHDYQQYQASVTGPVSDSLALRVTGYRTTRDGLVDNITTGKKTNTLHREGGRAQLLYKPSSDISIRLIGEYAREQQSSGAVSILPTTGVNFAAIQTKLTATGAKIAIDPDGLTTAVDGPVRTGTRQGAGSAEINWKLGEFTLTSISAYRQWTYKSGSDTEGSSADVVYGGYNIKDDQYTQELRLALPRMGNVDAIGGLFYFRQKLHTDQLAAYGNDAAAWLSGIPNSLLPTYARASPAIAGLLAYNNSRWDTLATPLTNSYAAFGQAIWHITPQWNFTGGLRVTHETKEEDVSRAVPISRVTGLPVAALASQAAGPIHASLKNTAPSFLISTDYHFTPNVMAYALVSRGQKAGGLNTTLPPSGLGADALKVNPEIATNYEAGLKTELFDHKLILNLGIYRTDVRDYQANVLVEVNNTIVSLLTSAGKVRTQGVEAEATLKPVSNLTLHGFVGYNDARYGSYVNGPCPLETTGRPTCDLSGKPIAGAPKWTVGINGNYEVALGSRLTGYVSPEYSWRSKYFGSLDDSRYTLTGGYGLLNLRAGVRTADGKWDFSVWGRNVTNRHYASNYFNYGSLVPGIYVAFFGDPATYGATARVNF
jgi:iron complex outermembrane receptor protein